MDLSSQNFKQKWLLAHAARAASASLLAELMCASRARTLALIDAYAAALGDGLAVPYSTQLNPPLWELGHIGWFQEYWLTRNPQSALGHQADPTCPRTESLLPQADALYNSSRVTHTSRWQLPLPDLAATKRYLGDTLASTLALLANSPNDDVALYFYRLALFHEDMHSEAAVYMAQALGLALPAALITNQPAATNAAALSGLNPATLQLPATDWLLGYAKHQADTATKSALPVQTAPGFAFDNELVPHWVTVPACEIDASPVTWRRYLPFMAAGGYGEASFWSAAGWQWLESGQGIGLAVAPTAQGTEPTARQRYPRYLRPTGLAEPIWQTYRFGQWQALDLDAPACHLSYFEAQAWCRWAGRQLPTEVQWEYAAMTQPNFGWGAVWEWTASPFMPYPDFAPHPYIDYSAPWFDGRPVLRGASWATSPRMAHPRYRNYFTPERNDLHAGFRSCAVA
jgi:iron(II)-dependent oxidoreductase